MNEISPISQIEQTGEKIDFSRYLPLLEDDDISEDDKRAMLEAFWSITLSLVRLGWGAQPVQHALDARRLEQIACGKGNHFLSREACDSPSVIQWNDQSLVERFERAAGQSPQEEKES